MALLSNKRLNSQDDETLLSAYANGNNAAFEVLYRRHCDPLYRFIMRQCHNNTQLTEEIFQECWSSVIKSAAGFRGDAKFSTWLYQLCRNRIIDFARKSKTHHESQHDTSDSDYGPTLLAAENQQPDHKTQIEKCIELLQQMILELPSEQREVFILKQETEHTLEELAHITGSAIETVKSRLRYALKKLRDWMPGECL